MSDVWWDPATEPPVGLAWPPPEDAPVLAAFGDTWRAATFDPGAFFQRIPHHGSTGPAVLYYLVVGMLVAGASLFWSTIGPTGYGQDRVAELGIEVAPLTSFLLTPLLLIIGLGVGAAVTHLMLLIVRGATYGMGTTLRVFCYAYSPMIFGVVPVLGAIVGTIWMLVVAVIGLAAAHGVPTWKPALAVLLPFLMLISFFVLAVMAVIATGAAVLG